MPANHASFQPQHFSFKQPWHKQAQCIYLPHVVFSDLYHKYRPAFDQNMNPDKKLLRDFWKKQRAFKHHPIVDSPDFKPTQCIPLMCHGDGTPVVGMDRFGLGWCSMSSRAALTKEGLLPIWFVFDETDADATPEFYKIVSWSLKWLQLGLWPHEDHVGN